MRQAHGHPLGTLRQVYGLQRISRLPQHKRGRRRLRRIGRRNGAVGGRKDVSRVRRPHDSENRPYGALPFVQKVSGMQDRAAAGHRRGLSRARVRRRSSPGAAAKWPRDVPRRVEFSSAVPAIRIASSRHGTGPATRAARSAGATSSSRNTAATARAP